MQAGGRHRDDGVALADLVRAEELGSFDDADGGGGNVVVVNVHDTWVLRGLAAEQRAARLDAALGDAGNNVGYLLGDDLADRDVVLQEKWLRAADDKVVDAHGDQVDADGVVLVHRLSDGQLGADAVGSGREQRLLVLAQGEQAGEAADAALDLWAGGALGKGREQLYGLVAGFDGDTCGLVGHARVSWGVVVGHDAFSPF